MLDDSTQTLLISQLGAAMRQIIHGDYVQARVNILAAHTKMTDAVGPLPEGDALTKAICVEQWGPDWRRNI